MTTRTLPLSNLRADCRRCVGLCCVAYTFARSSDFPIDKRAGDPCPNLAPSFSCTVHATLDERGFRGCTAFDCFGAGQHVSSTLFPDRDWRSDPSVAASMFDTFRTATSLHEMLWHLTQARTRTYDDELARQADELSHRISRLTETVGSIAAVDIDSSRSRVRAILDDASEQVRAAYRATDDAPDPTLVPYADLAGHDLRRRTLRGSNLRGASLLGADMRGTDLAGSDLLGADLRGADLRGADLTNRLFLTPTQLGSARIDQRTLLPSWYELPSRSQGEVL